VTFDVVGDPGDVCQIQFFEFILNEGDPPVFTQDGSFQVDFPTTVEAEKSRIPGTFALHQNYPNPFNPSTTIRYTIPPSASFHHVKLEIYNTLGEKMNTLVNEQQGPGTYSVQWHARNESGMQVPSGVYFYRLNAGSFIEVRKMLFLQ
jgi:hypothetical protein